VERARARDVGATAHFLQGDALNAPLPGADLTIFLGLVDWLDEAEVASLFRRLHSRFLLFSFTEAAGPLASFNPYRLYRAGYDAHFGGGVYRARSYRRGELDQWLAPLGKCEVEFQPTVIFDPGRLVLVDRGIHS
jgi:hypothetical protein